MDAYIAFVKFLGWTVASWDRLARLIGEEGAQLPKKKKNFFGPSQPPLGTSLFSLQILSGRLL